MDAVPLDNLSNDLQQALRRRAEAEGKTTAEYVLGLIRSDLNATSWSAWPEQLSHDPPISDADIAQALSEGRREHDTRLLGATIRGEKP